MVSMRTPTITIAKRLKLLLIATVFAASLSIGGLLDTTRAQDSTQDQLNSELDELDEQIDSTRVQLDGIQEERKTLEQTLADLQSQISGLQNQISATKNEIARLENEIAEKQAEIDAQKVVLSKTFAALYKRSNASALELLVASDSFSEYLDTQEYVERLKDGISESVLRIQELKQILQEEEKAQEALLSELQGQELAILSIQAEQQRILTETRGQESLFQAQLDDLEAQFLQKEKELSDYLASLIASSVSLGPVGAGEFIGRLGNTGWSSGPHLHIQVYSSPGVTLNPSSYIRNNGLAWPVGGGGGWVSQGYHSGHRAIDIATTEGTSLRAIASGNIIHRGCLYTGTKFATFGVIIDHGGFYSSYIHMQAPNNSKYSACSINRRGSTYGRPSIDYSTTN